MKGLGTLQRILGGALFAAAALVQAETPPAWTEQDVTAPGPQGLLSGSWMQPVQPGNPKQVPLALILPGSGPTDRNGNGPHLQTDSYRLLAQGLAGAGIASVRIDKRGMFASQAAVADANAVVMSDYVDDVAQWIQVLRRRTGVACLWLVGHSEGGLLALSAAQRLGAQVCGLVLLATPGQRAGDVLRAQLRSNVALAQVRAQAFDIIARLEAGQRVPMEGMPAALQPLFAAPVQGFLIDLFRLDPPALLAAYPGPVLIVQGTQDLQVGRDDALRLQQAQPHAMLQWLEGASHTLKPVQGHAHTAQQATYRQPALPLHPRLVPAIVQFVRKPVEEPAAPRLRSQNP